MTVKFIGKISAVLVFAIILLGLTSSYLPTAFKELFSSVQMLLILGLVLVCLPMLIYKFNERQRKKVMKPFK